MILVRSRVKVETREERADECTIEKENGHMKVIRAHASPATRK